MFKYLYTTYLILAAVPSYQVYGQGTEGQGVLYNATELPVNIAVQPTRIGQAGDRQFTIQPAARLDLRNYPEYHVFLIDEKSVYTLSVPKSAKDRLAQNRFFHFVKKEEKVVLAKGISSKIIQQADAETTANLTRIQETWATRTEGNKGVGPSPLVLENIRSWTFSHSLNRQIGLKIIYVKLAETDYILVADCGFDKSQVSVIEHEIQQVLGRSKKPVQVFSPCCSDANAITIDAVAELADMSVENPVISDFSVAGKNAWREVNIGEFSGVDGTDSELNQLVIEYQRYQWLLHRQEQILSEEDMAQIRYRLKVLGCLLSTRTDSFEGTRKHLFAVILNEIQMRIARALVEKNFERRVTYRMVPSRSIISSGMFQDDGTFRAYFETHAPYRVPIRVKIRLNGIKKIEYRGRAWCELAKRDNDVRDKFENTWKILVPGADWFGWNSGEYCIRVTNSDGHSSVWKNAFRPEKDKRYVFSFDNVVTE